MKNKLRLIGVFMLLIFIFGILSIVYVIEEGDYLVHLQDEIHQVYIGAMSQLLMILIYGGLIALITPLIKSYHDNLSSYFLVSRSISLGFHLIGIILLMLFIPLSDAYMASNSQSIKDLAEVLRWGRDLTNHIGVIIPYLIGSGIFYYALFNLKHIKSWLMLLGFVGIATTLISSLLVMFGVISLVSPIFMILSIPLALQEIILALYLVFKKNN